MKTTDLQQEFIEDEFQDVVNFASKLIGFHCCDTVLSGDRGRGDDNTVKFQITADPYSANNLEDRINLAAFENYFYENYGKWKDRCYFDSPTQAFFALIKAWTIWNKDLSKEIKNGYIEPMKKFHSNHF